MSQRFADKIAIVTGARLRSIPLARYGEPADMAAAALILTSHDATYITGQTITVDGLHHCRIARDEPRGERRLILSYTASNTDIAPN